MWSFIFLFITFKWYCGAKQETVVEERISQGPLSSFFSAFGQIIWFSSFCYHRVKIMFMVKKKKTLTNVCLNLLPDNVSAQKACWFHPSQTCTRKQIHSHFDQSQRLRQTPPVPQKGFWTKTIVLLSLFVRGLLFERILQEMESGAARASCSMKNCRWEAATPCRGNFNVSRCCEENYLAVQYKNRSLLQLFLITSSTM